MVRMRFQTIKFLGDRIRLIDQRRLPDKLTYYYCHDVRTTAYAIRELVVRGAPAIGVVAGYGMAIASMQCERLSAAGYRTAMKRAAATLAATRPTAVNLFWSLERMNRLVAAAADLAPTQITPLMMAEAEAIHEEDRRMCRQIGEHGDRLLSDGDTVLTHCNAGSLATGGIGTALGVIYTACARGKKIKVIADETRPILQGARLTTWELKKQGVDVTLICDNMAASLMRAGRISKVIVGADRIARNLDFANKIGTYSVALAAKAHRIPFIVAAPSSTFDRDLPNGDHIPIEYRDGSEILLLPGKSGKIRRQKVLNPAFDVTPRSLVSYVVSENGVIRGGRRN